MNPQKIIPPGYREDHEGRLIPESKIRPIDLARDALVRELVAQFEAQAQSLSRLKARTLADIAAFVELSAERYEVNLGGNKGNVTLASFDGEFKVIRQVSDNLVFDEGLQAAKALIDECIQAWLADGSNHNIAVLVQDAFQVNKQGRINTGRVLGLRRHQIDDPRWKHAMDAISESLKTSSTSTYVRCYRRDAAGEYQPIALDLAGA